jgi:NAD(P)H-flavin reductase
MTISLTRSVVVKNLKLNSKFINIKFLVKDTKFKFRPGQFVIFKIKSNVFRSYSIFSSPKNLPYWEILVDITPNGPGCKYLSYLKKDDVVLTSFPVGNFFALNQRKITSVVLATTGCGIASIIPVIRQMIENKYVKNINLFWGLRNSKDICLKETLDQLSKTNDAFKYHVYLSKPESNWKGGVGHINKPLIDMATEKPVDKTAFYLCGNDEMVNEVNTKLQRKGFSSKNIHFETLYCSV